MDIVQAEAQIRALMAADRLIEAAALCRQILTAIPNEPSALHQLGVIAIRSGDLPAGVNLIRQAIALRANVAEYHFNLSQPLLALGRLSEAETALRDAARLDPAMAGARVNLGAVLAQQKKLPEAETEFRAALSLRPNDPATYVNLGRVCRWQHRLHEAIEYYHRAIEIDATFAGAYSALGSAQREAGRIGEAITAFKNAVNLQPGYRVAHSNLVYALHFDPDTTPQENFAEHLRWAAKFAEPLRKTIEPHPNDRDLDRRLRIGYVSPDLRNHPVGLFIEPILEQHDRQQVEVFCYADVAANDDMTQRLRTHADVWRQTSGTNDQQLAQLIRADRIDVLIDLTLHMQRSRLAMFAQKPAPVQITHLAYCATSGISAMDWCITDPNLSPPGLHEQWFTEKLLRLAETYWCYRPSATSPAVGPLPATNNGFITFGSLNSFAKMNPRVIELWAEVLRAIPNSRLAIHAAMGDADIAAREMFVSAGIAPNRLTLHGHQPRDVYLNLYNTIDIALDPFPYGGGTTSLDALWMGVPLITLAGIMPVARTGITLLKQIALDDLIAQTPDQYIRIASNLAGDLPRLRELRAELRPRLSASSLMNPTRYTQNLESAYRFAWKQWCDRR